MSHKGGFLDDAKPAGSRPANWRFVSVWAGKKPAGLQVDLILDAYFSGKNRPIAVLVKNTLGLIA